MSARKFTGGVSAPETESEPRTRDVRPNGTACPDCPATRVNALLPLVEHDCRFRCHSLAARQAIPMRWFSEYEFGLVRRGVVVRQLVDPRGEVVSLDAAGPGCLVVFDDHGGERCRPTPTGYAATDLKVCLLAAGTELEAPLATDLVRLQRDAMHRLERLADARGRANADHRVCALLRALCDTLTPPRPRDRLPVGLQQRDLGQLLGMRHETVCRVLTRLERLGVIARSDDGISITDRAQLDAM